MSNTMKMLKVKSFIREVFQTIILGVAIFVILQVSIQPYKVEGSSMHPTMSSGDFVLVNKVIYWKLPFYESVNSKYVFHTPRRGELVIFNFPYDDSRKFVKRVIAVPGDTLEIKQGTVIINSEVIDEPYVYHPSTENIRPITVPRGSYFVLGDNRQNSQDSRSFGLVSSEAILGRALISYWPISNLAHDLR